MNTETEPTETTPETLVDELERLHKLTTQGDWEQSADLVYCHNGTICAVSEPRATNIVQYTKVRRGGKDFREAMDNAAFIVAAHTHLPAIISSVADLTRRLQISEQRATGATNERDAWIEDAARFNRNEEFYHGLVEQIGKPFGVEAFTSDDGSIQQDVLCLKVPELVEAMRSQLEAAQTELAQAKEQATDRWLPIDSAPRDGSEVLIYSMGDMGICYWRDDDTMIGWTWGMGMRFWNPTHWQPLPMPPVGLPEATGGDEGGGG